jgi:hypothetical protein
MGTTNSSSRDWTQLVSDYFLVQGDATREALRSCILQSRGTKSQKEYKQPLADLLNGAKRYSKTLVKQVAETLDIENPLDQDQVKAA